MISKAQPDMFSKLIELEAKRAIEELRHRYWFAILDKDVESLSSCFDENACLDYGFDIKLEGRNNIKEFFSGILGDSKLIIQVRAAPMAPSHWNPMTRHVDAGWLK